MTLSEEQKQISLFCQNRLGNLLVHSVPGSGKTTTLLHCVIPNLVFKQEEILVLMFSKSIQVEFAAKAKVLGYKSKISTFHATGFGMLTSAFKATYDKDKLKKIGKRLNVYKYDVYKLVSLAKIEGVNLVAGLSGIAAFEYLAEEYNLELTDYEISQAKRVFDESNRDKKTFDYDDMIYAPVFHNLSAYGYKAVLVDEFQDISPLRFEFLKRCFKKDKTRFIMVGDPNQSIFGWNGADSNIFKKLKDYFSAETLPLSTSWRCSKLVTAECNKIFGGMESRDGAPDGSVSSLNLSQFSEEDFSLDTFILCRVNAPLVKIAFSLLNRGYKCRIQGREIGQELISYCKKWKWENFNELRSKLSTYLKKKESTLLPANKKQYKAIEDKFEIIESMIQKCLEVGKAKKEDLFQFIELMFKDEGDEIVLSTPYKVKGLEKKDVYVYGADCFFPPPWAEKADLPEEKRVKFVAVSRAKENLYYVNLKEKESFFSNEKPNKNFTGKLPRKGAGTNKSDFVMIPDNSDIIDF